MTPEIHLLAPRPRRTVAAAGRLEVAGPVVVSLEGKGEVARCAWNRLRAALAGLGVEARPGSPAEAAVRLRVAGGGEPQGYRLEVRPEPGPGEAGIEVRGSDPAGLFYGVATLEQWLRLNASADGALELRGLSARDRPDFPVRGVMLDVSRNRVPTLESVLSLADRLAGWKINQLQLYTEHTFAYRGHETVWRGASPWTAAEVRALDAHCCARAIELVPNQNSFGHFHRWLVHEPYRRLAECPEGTLHPFSSDPEPFSLCPTEPGSLELLADLYDQLLPNFESRLVNVGLDETLDLCRGRSAEACAARGKERVYLDFVRRVHALARERGRRIQMWGDIVLAHPETIPELPEDAVLLGWGYEADHPFAEDGRRFAEAGREHYVCPGTSSWNSFAGRGRNALENLAGAALGGSGSGAAGYLITDWGDNGHLQPPAVSRPPILAGASFAWNAESARSPSELLSGELLDLHAFPESPRGTGRAALELADAYLATGARPKNGTVLFHLLASHHQGLEHPRYEGMHREHLLETLARIDRAGGGLSGTDLASRELGWAADAMRLGARLGLARLSLPPGAPLAELAHDLRQKLLHDLDSLTAELGPLWLTSSRPGGLRASRGRLQDLSRQLQK